ncbi:MAG: fumarylacetoacetate hydrolase family protein [Chloroflexi bacterium]|nr:fumarylacetoacetate hydrolase family protein [Chloroflexota bacterium]
MKLVTFTQNGSTRIGAMSGDDAIVDLNAVDASLPATMLDLLAGGDEAMERARAASGSDATIPLSEVTLEAPIGRPGKALAVGLNYRDHAEESGQEIPKHPVVFAKVTTCITGPGKPIHVPRVSRAVDWEGEMCIVIGKNARYVAKDDVQDYIAGYMVGNDVSVRDWQFHSPTWMTGKGFDTHGPIGPWLVTRDEVDGSHLEVKTFVNDELKQESNTNQLIFGVGDIIEYLSAACTLEPGDVIFTGTPAGVGVARRPPQFLEAGDTVRVEIEGLGVLENPVIEEPRGAAS